MQYADGRTRAFVNDQPVSVQVLKAIGGELVEIHGQHDDRALVDPAQHRTLLDAFGGLGADATALREAHARLAETRAALKRHTDRMETARKEVDFLRHAVEELTARAGGGRGRAAGRASPDHDAGREGRQGSRRGFLDAVGGPSSPVPVLSAAVRRLERRATQAPQLVEPCVKALDAALVALDDARAVIETALRDAEFDPRDLEMVEERAVYAARRPRKYDVPADDLAALCERYTADVASIDAGEAELVALETAVAAAEALYVKKAGALSKARLKVAAKLDAAVNAELPPLKLERARFITRVDVDDTARLGGGLRPCRVLGRNQSGHAAGAFDEGRVRRRAVALHAGLEGGARRPRLRADACL